MAELHRSNWILSSLMNPHQQITHQHVKLSRTKVMQAKIVWMVIQLLYAQVTFDKFQITLCQNYELRCHDSRFSDSDTHFKKIFSQTNEQANTSKSIVVHHNKYQSSQG